jgi:signal transduction histidine kinase
MRLGIKGKQVLGVTSIVGAVVVILSFLHLARLASVGLEESRARAELLANAILHRAREVVSEGDDPYHALRADSGLRAILESNVYSKNMIFAAIADVRGMTVVHADRSLEDQALPPGNDLMTLLARPALSQLATIYSGQGRTFEYRQPLFLGGIEFGSIRIGVSTLLLRNDLNLSLRPAVAAAFAALGVSIIVATLLAQLLLRPIHVIRSGLTRLGRGEFGVRLDLDQHDEFGELGTFFNTVSQQLSADRSQMAGQVANLESAVEQLEDAVAIVNARGELLFANPAMRELIPAPAPGAALTEILAPDHPLRRLSEQTLASRQSHGPLQATFADRGERLVTTHPINDPHGDLVGVMVTARNLQYLDQVQSTVRYSRKLAALGRLSAGVAHEVKNPLNAMMIHLELLRQKVAAARPSTLREPQSRPEPSRGTTSSGRAGAGHARGELAEPRAGLATVPAEPPPAALEHVDVIANEIRRLDQVLQGFLKFTRTEDLKLQPLSVAALVDEVVPIVRPEAEQRGVALAVDCDSVPDINGDPAMLRQAFLNLALNACQAMPTGGTLRIRGERQTGRRVGIAFTDTGTGIAPEHLKRIFDLYFTTKEKGSGIGLSMVYRTVQMHDGDIEVQSTPGVGTTFKVLLPQA